MKPLWIRVDAHKVNSVEIIQLSDALGISCVLALGHVVALGGEIAEALPDGRITDVADTAIERWAQWGGKKGVFAAAVRQVLQDEAGEFDHWTDAMGKLVERRAKDRNRKALGNSTETARKTDGNSSEDRRLSAATVRNGTERDGTERSITGRSEDLPGASPPAGRAAPPARTLAEPTAELPPEATRFLDTFYAGSSLERYREVHAQLVAMLSPTGARWKHSRVRTTPERQAQKCLEVIADGVRNSDKALPVLFTKLADTSDVTDAAVHAERERIEHEDRIAAADLAHANAWLADQPDVSAAIDAQLGPRTPGTFAEIARQASRDSLAVQAWRRAGAPQFAQVAAGHPDDEARTL